MRRDYPERLQERFKFKGEMPEDDVEYEPEDDYEEEL